MVLAVLRRVSTLEEAVVMISALRSTGIDAELFDTLGQLNWNLQTALGGFRVMVLSSQFLEAREFLSGAPPGDVDQPARPSTARRKKRVLARILLALMG